MSRWLEERGPIRIGVVGTGAITQLTHLPILAERDDVDVVALSDRDDRKARTIAGRFRVPNVLSDDALFASDDIEAVVICTPNYQHRDLTIAALRAGKHVLVERPLALDPGGVSEVVAAAEASGLTLLMGMHHRYRPDVAALRAFIAGGELGELGSARIDILNRRVPSGRMSWRHRLSEAGGGALMDLGVQGLDLGLWLMGYPEVVSVRATLRGADEEVEDGASLFAVTSGGVGISMDVSWDYVAGEDRRGVRITGSEGAGALPPLEVYKLLGGRPMNVTPRQPVPRGGEDLYTNAHRRELDHFVRAVAGETRIPLPREQESLMAIIEAGYRSAREGREVLV
jgi:predicted dehydrogenase